jgi:hypothetical protein
MIYSIKNPSSFCADVLKADFENRELVLGVAYETHRAFNWIEKSYEIIPLHLAQEGSLHAGCWQQVYQIIDTDWLIASVVVHWYDHELRIEFVA